MFKIKNIENPIFSEFARINNVPGMPEMIFFFEVG